MFCKKCGKALADESKFCEFCGSQIDSHIKSENTVEKNELEISPKPVTTTSTNRRMFLVFGTIIVVLVIFLAISVAFNIKSRSQASKQTSDQIESVTEASEGDKDSDEIAEEVPNEQESASKKKENPKSKPKKKSLREYSQSDKEDEWTSIADEHPDNATEPDTPESPSDEYIIPGIDSKMITEDDLNGLSAEECRRARNEVVARHGRRFKDAELQEYFDDQPWYEGTIDPDKFNEKEMLNEYEIRNMSFILEYEKKHFD